MDPTSIVTSIILYMDYEALMQIYEVANIRWNELFPDWEIVTLTAPKNDPEYQKRVIEFAFRMIELERKNTKCVWPEEFCETDENINKIL